jgi:outer membrane protein
LSKLPQYTEAQARLDAQIKAWETELQTLQAEYDAKKPLLKMKKYF